MLDQNFTRDWADTHDQLARWIDDAVVAARQAFEALHHQQWHAPWNDAPAEPRR